VDEVFEQIETATEAIIEETIRLIIEGPPAEDSVTDSVFPFGSLLYEDEE
jgi:hypothetical protein